MSSSPREYRATVQQLTAAMRARMQGRLSTRDDAEVLRLLSEAVYAERRRLSGHTLSDEDRAQAQAIERAARAIRKDRAAHEAAILALTDDYVREIHNVFSPRTYRFATRVLPSALTRLLTATNPRGLVGADFDPASRIVVQGATDRLRELAKSHTLVFAPTHVSNLDSPLIGYALHAAGLPPVIYGAGLNLFSNPVMGFFMSRLGAYTVDRRKRHELYKDVLKQYSVENIGRGRHSLFFPGGTRSRSGRVEQHLKMGLLGTAITAWQEGLDRHRTNPEILVVPTTLSFAMVLEAETLIEDSLAEEGKARYIISDDEFSEPRVVASFARQVLNLDAAAHIRFGDPVDLLGNPVDERGRSLDRHGEPVERARYVLDTDGRVEWDAQRDHVYTRHLADALVTAYHRDTVALSTHVAAFAAWHLLQARHPQMDMYRLVLVGPQGRQVERTALLRVIERLLTAIHARVAAGALREALPNPGAGQSQAQAVLTQAIDRFSRFHSRRALELEGDRVLIDPKLALYYGNRLVGHQLQAQLDTEAK